MALVHDLAEAHVGDITPVEGVPAGVKHELEQEAMDNFLDEMLGGEGNREARERFRSLWDVSYSHDRWAQLSPQEYETRETPESRLVKDLDRLELALQGVEYERCKLNAISYTGPLTIAAQDITTLSPFFTGSIRELTCNRHQ